jgi:hypothetical protein
MKDAHDAYALATFSSTQRDLIDDSEEDIQQARVPSPGEGKSVDVIPIQADNSIGLGFDDPLTTDILASTDHTTKSLEKTSRNHKRSLSGIALGVRDMPSNNISQSEASFEGDQPKMPGMRSALLDEYSHAREQRKALATTLPESGTDVEDSSMEEDILDQDESNTNWSEENPTDNSQ